VTIWLVPFAMFGMGVLVMFLAARYLLRWA
jgi:hypothetical protein